MRLGSNFLLVYSILVFAVVAGCSGHISYEKLMEGGFGELSYPPETVKSSVAMLPIAQKNQFLLKAFETGRIEYIGAAIEAGADPALKDSEGIPFFLKYFEEPGIDERQTVINAVLRHSPQVLNSSIRVANGNDIALSVILEKADQILFEKICMAGANLNIMNDSGVTPLMRVAGSLSGEKGKVWRLQALIKHGANPLLKDKMGATVLHWIEWIPGDEDFAPFLDSIIEIGVDINSVDEGGDTPLHRAVFPYGTIANGSKLISYLIEHGALKEVVNAEGATPLDLAIWVSSYTTGTEDTSIVLEAKEIAEIITLLK